MWVAAAVAIALFSAAWVGSRVIRDTDSSAAAFAFVVSPPAHGAFNPSAAVMAVSPDGAYLAFVASGAQGNFELWLRRRDTLALERLPNTAGGVQPFWSPDSRVLGFSSLTTGALRKIDLSSRLVQTIAAGPSGQAGSWNRDGVILFGSRCGPPSANAEPTMICRVAASGGEPQPATRFDASRGETVHAWPQFLPDGRHFLYLARSRLRAFDGIVYAASLDDPTPIRITAADSNAVYSPPGYLVFMQGTALVARRFDAHALRLDGEPMVIADPVERNAGSGKGAFSLSENGVLAYRQPQQTELEWYAMDGRELGVFAGPAHYANAAVSPDGSQIAIERATGDVNTMDIWLYDRSGTATRFSVDQPRQPLWSPDGHSIAMRSAEGLVIRDAISGRQNVVVRKPTVASRPLSWTPDGAALIYSEVSPSTRQDIFLVPIAGGVPRPLVQTPFDDSEAQVSPDGRWLAYVSDESGQSEVYVRRFPTGDGKWLVSRDGGVEPQWTSGALLYLGGDRTLMSVSFSGGASFAAQPPVRLFATRMTVSSNPAYTRNQYLVTRDGRILINQPAPDAAPPDLTMIVNWPSLLKGR